MRILPLKALALLLAGFLVVACSGPPEPPTKVQPARIEGIEGSDFKRVVLTEQAAARTDIHTVPVREERVSPSRIVWGEVVGLPKSEGHDPGAVHVGVRLTESDLMKLDRGQPAIVWLDRGESQPVSLLANPVVRLALDEPDTASAPLFYEVAGSDHGLIPGQIVRVELSLLGAEAPQKIVPYSAVLYGLQGQTWVYTNPEPLVFVRQTIQVDYIEADMAILSAGPAAGTQVVVVGGAELYGAETGVSK